MVPVLTNDAPGLNGSYAGATVDLFGTNLTAPGVVSSVKIGGLPASILFSSSTRMTLQLPRIPSCRSGDASAE